MAMLGTQLELEQLSKLLLPVLETISQMRGKDFGRDLQYLHLLAIFEFAGVCSIFTYSFTIRRSVPSLRTASSKAHRFSASRSVANASAIATWK
eukprot:jgi/Pico_ML_1/55607/g1272.t2